MFMYVCMYVYIYLYIYTYTHTHIHIHAHTHIHNLTQEILPRLRTRTSQLTKYLCVHTYTISHRKYFPDYEYAPLNSPTPINVQLTTGEWAEIPASQASFNPTTNAPISGRLVLAELRRNCYNQRLLDNCNTCFNDGMIVSQNGQDLAGNIVMVEISSEASVCVTYFYEITYYAQLAGASACVYITPDQDKRYYAPYQTPLDIHIPFMAISSITAEPLLKRIQKGENVQVSIPVLSLVNETCAPECPCNPDTQACIPTGPPMTDYDSMFEISGNTAIFLRQGPENRTIRAGQAVFNPEKLGSFETTPTEYFAFSTNISRVVVHPKCGAASPAVVNADGYVTGGVCDECFAAMRGENGTFAVFKAPALNRSIALVVMGDVSCVASVISLARLVKSAGAVGLLIAFNSDLPALYSEAAVREQIPTFSISKSDGDWIIDRLPPPPRWADVVARSPRPGTRASAVEGGGEEVDGSSSDGVAQERRVDGSSSDGVAQERRVDGSSSDGMAQERRVDGSSSDGVAQERRVDGSSSDGVAQERRVDAVGSLSSPSDEAPQHAGGSGTKSLLHRYQGGQVRKVESLPTGSRRAERYSDGGWRDCNDVPRDSRGAEARAAVVDQQGNAVDVAVEHASDDKSSVTLGHQDGGNDSSKSSAKSGHQDGGSAAVADGAVHGKHAELYNNVNNLYSKSGDSGVLVKSETELRRTLNSGTIDVNEGTPIGVTQMVVKFDSELRQTPKSPPSGGVTAYIPKIVGGKAMAFTADPFNIR